MIPTPPDAHTAVILLFIAAIVALLAKRIKLPTSAGLLAAGVALAFIPGWKSTSGLDQHTLFTLLLPPLIFEGSLNLRWQFLKLDMALISALATIGVVAAALVASSLMHYCLHWAWTPALYFGVLIAATDPIAVLSNFKELGVEGRPRTLVEAESLLNDGTAVVLFGMVGLLMSHSQVSAVAFHLVFSTFQTVGGGIFVGMAVGWLAISIAGRSDDHLTATTLTIVGAYGSYFLAERIGGTGILASVAAGLVMGNVGIRAQDFLTDRARDVTEAFWDFAAFVANSLVFLLMGLYLGRANVLLQHPGLLIAGIVTGLVARAVTVYGTSALFARSSQSVPLLTRHVLFWGGQRGGLSLVLSLGLVTANVPQAADVVAATTGLVAFSILVQGTSFRPLLRRFERPNEMA